MSYSTLISPEQLHALRESGVPTMVFDCSFDLTRPDSGVLQYAESHIPGAVYANLDTDLSAAHGRPDKHGSVIIAHEADRPASGGRHPLPSRERFAYWLSAIGFTNQMQAVVYDRNAGAYCGRLWWMLKWMGHDAVAVLDGGMAAWQAAGFPLSSEEVPAHFQSNFVLHDSLVTLTTTDTVVKGLDDPAQTIVDSRAGPRYRGEVEPLDPIAGHIPGALNRPYTDNFGPDGRFKSPDVLRSEFEALLAGREANGAVFHCGSGVTATPNVLAMQLAGLGTPALYAGSWSEWSNTPGLPTKQGAEP